MTHEEAWAGYREYKKKFEDAGIPWNQKGSPHRLLLKAKWYAKQLPINKMIAFSMRYFAPQLAANITANNVLLNHLKNIK